MDPTDIVVAGAGPTGSALARDLADAGFDVVLLDRDPQAGPAPEGVRWHPGTMLVDLVLGRDDDALAAVQILPLHGEGAILRTRALVLATGGVSGLLPGGALGETGDGLVLAHRAGVALHLDPTIPKAVIVTDGAGRTDVPGLYAAGAAAEDLDPGALFSALRRDLAGPLATRRPVGDVHLHPDVDSPMPEGFASLKMERLRALLAEVLGPKGDPASVPRVAPALHRLKGEADAFDRARLDADLRSLRFACEAGVLLVDALSA